MNNTIKGFVFNNYTGALLFKPVKFSKLDLIAVESELSKRGENIKASRIRHLLRIA